VEKFDIYKEIAKRANGDIYIGVVGPVRTGKSTFIKRFMESLVIPNIDNSFVQERARDELPQSAAGRMIMTTEPKFVPNEAVEIELGDGASFNVRMIDCVGYIVDSALGHIEEDMPRMVSTPWFDHPIEFNHAAEIGTQKVIKEHSTIGVVITTDGSIGEIGRSDFIPAEERVINELKEINKPFVIVVNTRTPQSEETEALRASLEQRWQVPVMAVNCMDLDKDGISAIMEKVLFEFPVREICIKVPGWINGLAADHWLRSSIYKSIRDSAASVEKIRQIKVAASQLDENEFVDVTTLESINLGTGSVNISLIIQPDLFYKILGEQTGLSISCEQELFKFVSEFSAVKKEYDKFSEAINDVREKGYGIVAPNIDELKLEEPEIVKTGGKFGVKLRASSPSIHMIRADIETEVSPIVGSERQSEELVKYLLQGFEEDPAKIWESNIFGKSLHELVNEGLHAKLGKMPDDARKKLQQTLTQIINEGSGGLICIIL